MAQLSDTSVLPEHNNPDRRHLLTDDVRAAQLRIFTLRTSQAGDHFTRNVQTIFTSSKLGTQFLYQVLPIQAFLQNQAFSLVLGAIILMLLYMAGQNVEDLANLGKTSFKFFRFTERRRHGFNQNVNPNGSLSFGLLSKGCAVSFNNATNLSTNTSFLLSFTEEVISDGWYFDIPQAREIPEFFELEGSNDNLSWTLIGASSRRLQFTSFAHVEWVFRPEFALSIKAACNNALCNGLDGIVIHSCNGCLVRGKRQIIFDHRWTLPMLLPLIINVEIAVLVTTAVLASFWQEYWPYISWILALGFTLCGSTFASFAVLWCTVPDYTGEVHPEQSIYPSAMAFVSAISIIFAGLLDEPHLPDLLILLGAAIEVVNLVELLMVNGTKASLSQGVLASVQALLFITTAITMKLNAVLNLRNAKRCFLPYTQRANTVLEDLLRCPENEQLLNECSRTIETYTTEHKPIRQYIRYGQRTKGADEQLGSRTFWSDLQMADHEDEPYAVTTKHRRRQGRARCLDQLMAKAGLMGPFLKFKVEQWASMSAGYFHAIPTGYVSAMEISSGQSLASRIKWAKPKSQRRIAEKYLCTLNRDGSRLNDLCRQRIVFDDMRDLTSCMTAIMDDQDVIVQSIANSMRGAGSSNAEYHRCITLDLRIVTPDTMRLGIQAHVCEVQLMLRSLADLQDARSHVLYTEYKNACDCGVSAVQVLREQVPRLLGDGTVGTVQGRRFSADEAQPWQPLAADMDTEGEGWLLTACRKFALYPGNAISSQLFAVQRALSRASVMSCFFTSTPIAAALSKPAFQVFMVLIGIVFMFGAVVAVNGFNTAGAMQYNHYRFTVIRFRDQPINRSWAGLSRLGLLLDGCETYSKSWLSTTDGITRGNEAATAATVAGTNASVDTGVGLSWVISLAAPIPANGWFFETPRGPGAGPADPVQFKLEGSPDMMSWILVGSSSYAIGEGGRIGFFDSDYSQQRAGIPSIFDMRPPLVWLAAWFGPYATAALTYWTCAAVGVAGQCLWIRSTAMWWYAIIVVELWACCGIYVARGSAAAAGACALRSTCFVGFGLLIWHERRLVHWMGYLGVYWMSVEILILWYLEAGPEGDFGRRLLMSSNIWLGATELAFSAFHLVACRDLVHRATTLVCGDRRLYDVEWARLVASEETRAALSELARTARPYETANRPRQLNSGVHDAAGPHDLDRTDSAPAPHSFFASEEGSARGPVALGLSPLKVLLRRASARTFRSFRSVLPVDIISSQSEFGRPVRCLDQLMAQAIGLDPALRVLVVRWATQCNGYFSCDAGCGDSRQEYRRCQDLLGNAQEVRWAKLKLPQRAIEKAVRSYGLDASYLVDLCRQTMYFHTVEDLCACLNSIAKDPDAQVVRVKNRMCLDSDCGDGGGGGYCWPSRAAHPTGYRDVSVNLRIRTGWAKSLGLDGHVCEVQLLLVQIANVKHDQGHARYVEWRNRLGE